MSDKCRRQSGDFIEIKEELTVSNPYINHLAECHLKNVWCIFLIFKFKKVC